MSGEDQQRNILIDLCFIGQTWSKNLQVPLYVETNMVSSAAKNSLTTGNRDFAECKFLCRVSKIGHLAKIFFAECYTRQRIALGKYFFAECRALGKHGHSAKDFFADCQTLGKISPLGIGCPRNGALLRPSLPSACG